MPSLNGLLALVRALLTDGVSTRDEVTLLSGRGVGMAAVEKATTGLGGAISVVSEPGRGTEWSFTFPYPLCTQA